MSDSSVVKQPDREAGAEEPARASREVPLVISGVGKNFHGAQGRRDTLKESILGSLFQFKSGSAFRALEGIDLTVSRGESIGIVGANGSGKSTLLKLIAGITEPSEGTIDVCGRVLGLIELGAGFHPELTGEENVRLQESIYGLSASEGAERLDEVFDYAELHDFRATPLKHYSSGMIVRLGFASALACDPELLLIDEMLSVGDERFQRRCLASIEQLRADGVTILFVTHQMEIAERVCDRILWLKRGRTHRLGPSFEVLEAYQRESLLEDYKDSEGALTQDRVMAGHPGRFGIGGARIEALRTTDLDGRPRRNFSPSQTICIEIEYSREPEIEALDCHINLDYEDGMNIAFWSAEEAGHLGRPAGPRGRFRLTLPSAPLMAGRYTLSVSLSKPGGGGVHYDLFFRLHHFTVVAEPGRDAPSPLRLWPRAVWSST